ncbi:MAG: alanine racemase [Sinobacteraceae bacterium]|nr:alanine racemase [Nevskiaceae bacterium]
MGAPANSPLRALIDLAALRANFEIFRRAAPRSKILAVVKANAYGHGVLPVARALGAADGFAVARLEEAIELREAGLAQRIVLLEGVFSIAQLRLARAHRLDLVLHDNSQLEMLEAEPAAGEELWIKIDTGMNRLGFRPEHVPGVQARLRSLLQTPSRVRLMSHFARADDDAAMTAQQTEAFLAAHSLWAATGGEVPEFSLANSAGVLLWPKSHGDWIRPGIGLYGASPCASRADVEFALTPVMTLQSAVIAIRCVAAGESVGYGATWRASRPSRIAIVAAGYADGVPRHLPSGAPVLIEGQRAPLAGRVSMDMIAVDVTDLPQAKVGSPVVLWGRGLPVNEVAAAAGTLAYELLCGVGRRAVFEYLD